MMMMMNGLKQKTDKVFSGRKVSSLIQVTCSVCVLNCNDYGAIKKEGRVSAQRSQHSHVNGPTRYNLRNPRPPPHSHFTCWVMCCMRQWGEGGPAGRRLSLEGESQQTTGSAVTPIPHNPTKWIQGPQWQRPGAPPSPRSKLSSNMQMGRSLSLMFDYLMFI